MPRGRITSLTIYLMPAERQMLLAWQRATTISAGRARRGRIILLLADGVTISDIAATVGISRRFVYKWAQRFLSRASRDWPTDLTAAIGVWHPTLPWRSSTTCARDAPSRHGGAR